MCQENGKQKRIAGEIIFFLLVLIIVALFSRETCSFPLGSRVPGTDSGVFIYMGKLITTGGMPYRDSFDHKGPVLYIINAIAELISPVWGLWMVETVTLMGAFLLCYSTLRMIISREAAFVILCFAFSPLAVTLSGGNNVEEYALVFISFCVFCFCRYRYNGGDISKTMAIVCGFCCAAVLLLRPNMIAVWTILVPVYFFSMLRNNIRKAFAFCGCFVLGGIGLVIPVFVWLIVNESFKDFWNCYILFNFSYTGTESEGVIENVVCYILIPSVLLSLISSIFLLWRKRRFDAFVSLGCVLLSIIMAGISGRHYLHYRIPLFPITIIPLGVAWKEIEMLAHEKTHRAMRFLVPLMILMIFFSIVSMTDNSRSEQDGIHELGGIISENTEEGAKISVYGNCDALYLFSGRMAASYYSYQEPISQIDPDILERYFEDLAEEPPAMIITSGGEMERMREFLAENDYAFLYSYGLYGLWKKTDSSKNN